MAKQELFKGFFGWAISSVGAFPVKRGESDTEAIRKAAGIRESGAHDKVVGAERDLSHGRSALAAAMGELVTQAAAFERTNRLLDSLRRHPGVVAVGDGTPTPRWAPSVDPGILLVAGQNGLCDDSAFLSPR